MTIKSLMLIIISFLFMEGFAWLAHKYLMHGWLWKLHRDHHKKETYGFLEKNDYFFLIFALPGIACLAIGIYSPLTFLLYVGIGITLYGMAYFVIHDVFIHQRLPFLKRSNNTYLRAIRRAHKMHHKHLDKEDGECFGMLIVPFKYLKQELKAARND